MSALAGTLIVGSARARSKATSTKAPVISSPAALSTKSCIRVVPDATSTAWAEAFTAAGKVRPEYSGSDSCALVPILMLGT